MRNTMPRRTELAAVLCLLAAGTASLGVPAMAAPAERYLHVRVQDPAHDQSVRVNVPLSLAEKVLPAINNHDLHDGKVFIHNADMNGVDIPAVLEALRTAPDNEFVTVKAQDARVRVAKSHGNIVVHVVDKKNGNQRVDVTVPFQVADALFATAKNGQLDVASALQALSHAGDILLVSVQNSSQKVRVWVDSRHTQD